MDDVTEAPAEWQCGIDLERLRLFAEPFRQRHKPLVFGAFGLTKERDLAPAMAEGRVIWTGTPPEAVIVTRLLGQTSHQTDFTGLERVIPAGAVMAGPFAATSAQAAVKVLQALQRRAGGKPVWLELFEEDTLAKRYAEGEGFRYAFTKIAAGSEVKGVYCWGAEPPPPHPACEYAVQEVLLPEFLSKREHAAILAELDAWGDHWEQHYSSYNRRKSWTAFALQGYDDDPGFIIKPREMARSWQEKHPERLDAHPRPTEAAKAFPATLEALRRIPGTFDRIRFMRLRAKDGELSRHADITDRDAGLRDGRLARLHIPVRTSDAVTFHGWSARGEHQERHFPERCLFFLDQRKPHRVENRDPELDRVHIVVDVTSNPKLRSWFDGPHDH
jgi:hypothetical protein